MSFDLPLTIEIRRTHENVIEYTITVHDPISGDQSRTYHANRYATFMGPHTGLGNEQQIHGGAKTLWREDDNQLMMAFKRSHKNIVNIVLH